MITIAYMVETQASASWLLNLTQNQRLLVKHAVQSFAVLQT